jgi:EEF1A N-terminal glycine/lysine methyltransferase
VELGAGCGLPSLLAATLREDQAPSLVVVTDYPDDMILGNLKMNVEVNRDCFNPKCNVVCEGYEWGTDTGALM